METKPVGCVGRNLLQADLLLRAPEPGQEQLVWPSTQSLVPQGQVAPEFTPGLPVLPNHLRSHVNHICILATAEGHTGDKAEAESMSCSLLLALSFHRPPTMHTVCSRNSWALSERA